MRNIREEYQVLIKNFVEGKIPVDEFQETYFSRFKNEGHLDEHLYQLLDEMFGDIDAYTTDPDLFKLKPGFYLTEFQLRNKAADMLSRLSK